MKKPRNHQGRMEMTDMGFPLWCFIIFLTGILIAVAAIPIGISIAGISWLFEWRENYFGDIAVSTCITIVFIGLFIVSIGLCAAIIAEIWQLIFGGSE